MRLYMIKIRIQIIIPDSIILLDQPQNQTGLIPFKTMSVFSAHLIWNLVFQTKSYYQLRLSS